MTLSLGTISFASFEIPSVVSFGGAQSLAVYRLPGGVRVVDALGADDADIAWKGVLSGGNATYRARALDALRIAGQPVVLAWDEFVYSVVIKSLQFAFHNSWWIHYKITCLIVDDPDNAAPSAIVPLVNAVITDITTASAYTDVSQALTALMLAGSDGNGTTSYASASIALTTVSQTIDNSLQASAIALASLDLPTAVGAAGNLAMAAVARGFVARATANYKQLAF